MNESNFLRQSVFEYGTKKTLSWLERSIEATYGGSAATFHLWRGWTAPYPETTGYIIETLLDYAGCLNNSKWRELAITCADWLCKIQHGDGAFPGGVGTDGAPLIFDTGQILFGLVRVFQETGDLKYRITFSQAVAWLINVLESDNSWQQFAYMPGYTPAYYTRVIWAILYANQELNDPQINAKMQQALAFYFSKITPQLSIENWGFAPREMAFTHTIAYTLRGMLESSFALQVADFQVRTLKILGKIATLFQQKKKLAGRYDLDWNGDYSFQCVTGDAQISLLFARAFQLTNRQIYLETALNIFAQVVDKQWLLPMPGFYGAIPGSSPIWGAYQRFSFPNWAAKFYLDAYLLLKKITSA